MTSSATGGSLQTAHTFGAAASSFVCTSCVVDNKPKIRQSSEEIEAQILQRDPVVAHAVKDEDGGTFVVILW